MNNQILIIGKGEIGSALGKILQDGGLKVLFFDKNEALSSPGLVLEKALAESRYVFLCIPSWSLRNALDTIKPFLNGESILINLAKGMESDGKTMDQVIKEAVGNRFVLMSGPMLAEEISLGQPGFAVLAASSATDAGFVSDLFLETNIRTEISDDLRSVVLAGVLKNVYALAFGIASGLGLTDNLRGLLISGILREWFYVSGLLGVDDAVAMGTAGIGDFMATALSHYSKNRELGEKIVSGSYEGLRSEGLASLPGLIKITDFKNSKWARVLRRKADSGLSDGLYLEMLRKIVIDHKPAAEVFRLVMPS